MLKPPPQDQLEFDPTSFAAEPTGEYDSIEQRKCGARCDQTLPLTAVFMT
jgi:hypothetical protein